MTGKISHPTSISHLLSWICFCTIFTGSRQPLCSPSSPHMWRGLAAGLPILSSVGIESGGSLDSASVLRPSGSTMASSSLVSTGARQSSSSIGLPCPSSSVSRPPTSTSGLHSSGYALSLRHSGSIGLPPQLSLHLGRLRLRLGPPDPQLHPGSLALCHRLWLHYHLFRRRWSTPWSQRPLVHHGSSLRRLLHGSPSWLWPAFLPALRRPLSPSHIHSFILLLSPPPSLPLFLRCEVMPGRGVNCHNPLDSSFVFCLCSLPVCPYLVLFWFSLVHCLIIN